MASRQASRLDHFAASKLLERKHERLGRELNSQQNPTGQF